MPHTSRLPRSVQQSAKLLATAAAMFLAVLPATAQTAPQRPAITGIAHIALAAQSLEADRAFYTHYLGWKAVPSAEYPNGLRFYGDPRQSVVVHPAGSPSELAFDHIAWATADASALRLYLKSKGIAVPASVTRMRNGEQYFRVHDPEGNVVEFLQHAGPGSRPDAHDASGGMPGSISGRIIHAGFIVRSAAAENSFYKDILGFHLYWTGGMKDGVIDFVSMQVPNGTDWVEYMLNAPPTPSKHQLGVDDHFSLGVPDMDPVVAEFQKRGFPPNGQTAKQMGRDGKVQLNEYDPDGVRIEYMEFNPRQAPCCHPFTGPQPSADK
jgi:catechol 2,3-dioxygenase-like lactoylglutathione lyase family enzyme